MATKDLYPTNQIAKIQTRTKLIALCDKLKPAPEEHYAQIHAKNEVVNGMKQNSLIEVQIQDQSRGTGDKNIIAKFRLEPEQIQFFLTRITAGFQEFSWSASKIYGDPDAQGLSIADTFKIERQPLGNDGQPKRNPWFIQIQNGRARKVMNDNGGGYMDGRSFVVEKSASINVTDMDLYGLLKRADAYIQAWENMEAMELIKAGQAKLEEGRQNRYGQNYQGTAAPQQGYAPSTAVPNYGYSQDPSYQTVNAGFDNPPYGYSVPQQDPSNAAPQTYNPAYGDAPKDDGFDYAYNPERRQ